MPPFEDLERFKDAERAEAEARSSGGGGGQLIAAAPAGAATLAALAGSLAGADGSAPRPVAFALGDKVIVSAAGDLHGLLGDVQAILPSGEVMVLPSLEGLSDGVLSFRPAELAKHFPAGSHVRVTLGRHEGSTGMVLSTDGDVAVLLTDVMREELRVFMRDLVDAKDASGGESQLGEFALFDLALLVDGVAGVIVHIERDASVVLTHNGPADRPELRHCRLADLQRRLNPIRHSAQDVNMAPIGRGDNVHITDGPLAGKSGAVQWCHRGYLFLKSREVIENAGIVCVRSKSVKVAGGSGRVAGAGSSALALAASPGSALRSPAHPGAGGGGGSSGMGVLRSPRLVPAALGGNLVGPPSMAAPRATGFGSFSGGKSGGGRRDDGLLGTRVKVASGAYKGYVGIVLDATDAIVRLELEANEKTVTIARGHLDSRGADALGAGRAVQPAWGTTPSRDVYGRTPVHLGNATPMRDAMMTPGRDVIDFGKTPARRNPWELTPGRDATTASFGGGAGGTPSWGGAPSGGGYGGGGGAVTPGDSARSGWTAGGSALPYGGGYQAAPAPYGTWGGATVSLSGGAAPSVSGMPTYALHAGTPAGSGGGTPALYGGPGGGGYGGTPAGSAAGGATPAGGGSWLIAGLLVRLRDSGKAAVVKSVAPDGRCLVAPIDTGVPMGLHFTGVNPTAPEARNERVRIIVGPLRGKAGRCVVVGEECLVELDEGKEKAPVPAANLCKCIAD
jgi:transcription elongation factor SPT5